MPRLLSTRRIFLVLSTASALALAWGCGGDEESSGGGSSGKAGAQGSGTGGKGGSSGGATGGSSGAATGGSSGAATGGSSGAATGGSSGAATGGSSGAATGGSSGAGAGGSSGAPTDGSVSDAGQCTGTHPLTDAGERSCEVGFCRCVPTDTCFPRAQAGSCCAGRFVCFSSDAGTVNCQGEHPQVDGSTRTCGMGNCYCSAPDACFPARQAPTCCTVAPVCN